MNLQVQVIADVSELEASLYEDISSNRIGMRKTGSIETINEALRAIPSVASFDEVDYNLSSEEQKEQIIKLSPYVPFFLQAKIAASPETFVNIDSNTIEEHTAAILAIDVSGFCTELFSGESTNDELHRMCNTFFSTIIASITKFNGDLLQFTGYLISLYS